ncbi:MAG: ParB N-terminal domain-containing protein [Candidatus Dormiibacterota bacterium]
MSDPSEAPDAPGEPARLGLHAGPLARWLAPTSQSRLEHIACSDIDTRPWPEPPGTRGDLIALTRSVRQRGIVEPLLLRPLQAGRFEVVLGARRLEAARRLGMTEVPAIVRKLDETEAVLVAVWNALPRLRGGQMIEVAAHLIAAGVSEPEIALLLSAQDGEAAATPTREWPLRADSTPLRFAGSVSPVQGLLDALGAERRPALAALRGVDPGRLARLPVSADPGQPHRHPGM